MQGIGRNLNGDFKSKLGVLKDENGNILTEEKEIQQRWKQYTQKLYSRDPKVKDHCGLDFMDSEPDILNSEVEWALNTLAAKKSQGCDEIPIKMVREYEYDGVGIMLILCNIIWKSGK